MYSVPIGTCQPTRHAKEQQEPGTGPHLAATCQTITLDLLHPLPTRQNRSSSKEKQEGSLPQCRVIHFRPLVASFRLYETETSSLPSCYGFAGNQQPLISLYCITLPVLPS